MKISEAWKLSKTPYVELVYRSSVMTRGTSSGLGIGRSPEARVKSVIRGALVSKAIFTLFIGLGTVLAFDQFLQDRTAAALVGGVTFSLSLSLAYIVLYSLQVLPSFSGAEAYSVLATLPLSDRDLSLITILSVARTFDSMVVAAVAVQVGVVAYLTGSAAAPALMLVAAVVNAVFGVVVSLWLTSLFRKNVTKGGRGKGASISRFVFVMSWGVAVASLGFLFNLVTYAVPVVESAVSGALSTTGIPIIISAIYPFSAGIAVATSAYLNLGSSSGALTAASILSLVFLALYTGLASVGARRALKTAASISRGPLVVTVRQRATEFLLRIRNPTAAYVIKDFRVSSKNPSTAFIYSLPVIETVIVALALTGSHRLGALTVITSTAFGCFFALVSASILLNTEGSGLDYTLSLPLSARVIVLAKSLISTVAFLPVPIAISLLLALGSPTSVWLYAIPLLEAVSVLAATSAELAFFIRGYTKRGMRQTSRSIETRGLNLMSAADLVRLAVALIVAGGLIMAPLAGYAAAYLQWHSHPLSVVFMAAVSLAETAAVQIYLWKT